ncbi:transducer protein Htr38, partial [Haloferax sp. BAB-2207]
DPALARHGRLLNELFEEWQTAMRNVDAFADQVSASTRIVADAAAESREESRSVAGSVDDIAAARAGKARASRRSQRDAEPVCDHRGGRRLRRRNQARDRRGRRARRPRQARRRDRYRRVGGHRRADRRDRRARRGTRRPHRRHHRYRDQNLRHRGADEHPRAQRLHRGRSRRRGRVRLRRRRRRSEGARRGDAGRDRRHRIDHRDGSDPVGRDGRGHHRHERAPRRGQRDDSGGAVGARRRRLRPRRDEREPPRDFRRHGLAGGDLPRGRESGRRRRRDKRRDRGARGRRRGVGAPPDRLALRGGDEDRRTFGPGRPPPGLHRRLPSPRRGVRLGPDRRPVLARHVRRQGGGPGVARRRVQRQPRRRPRRHRVEGELPRHVRRDPRRGPVGDAADHRATVRGRHPARPRQRGVHPRRIGASGQGIGGRTRPRNRELLPPRRRALVDAVQRLEPRVVLQRRRVRAGRPRPRRPAGDVRPSHLGRGDAEDERGGRLRRDVGELQLVRRAVVRGRRGVSVRRRQRPERHRPHLEPRRPGRDARVRVVARPRTERLAVRPRRRGPTRRPRGVPRRPRRDARGLQFERRVGRSGGRRPRVHRRSRPVPRARVVPRGRGRRRRVAVGRRRRRIPEAGRRGRVHRVADPPRTTASLAPPDGLLPGPPPDEGPPPRRRLVRRTPRLRGRVRPTGRDRRHPGHPRRSRRPLHDRQDHRLRGPVRTVRRPRPRRRVGDDGRAGVGPPVGVRALSEPLTRRGRNRPDRVSVDRPRPTPTDPDRTATRPVMLSPSSPNSERCGSPVARASAT